MPRISLARRFFHSRLFVVAGSLVVVFIATSAGREFYRNYLIGQEIRALEQQSRELEARRLELVELAKKVQSGDFFEEEARLKLGLQKEGETVVVVDDGAESRGDIQKSTPHRSNPQLWLDYFLHRRP